MPIQMTDNQVTFDADAQRIRNEDRLMVPSTDPDWKPCWVRGKGDRAEANLDWYLDRGYKFVRPGERLAPKSREGAEANPLRGNIPITQDPLNALIWNGDLVLMKIEVRRYEELVRKDHEREARIRGAVKRSISTQDDEVRQQISQQVGETMPNTGPLMYSLEDSDHPAEGPSDARELSRSDRLRDKELLQEQGIKPKK